MNQRDGQLAVPLIHQHNYLTTLLLIVVPGPDGSNCSLSDQQMSEPAGRVPPDALLFVQAATKSKQKMPIAGSGHVRMRWIGSLI